MDKSDYENQNISIYWWNLGKRQLDFKGTYKECLEAKGIEVSSITNRGAKGYKFLIPLSSEMVTLETYDTDYSRCCDNAIMIFLTLLGDKAKLNTPRREYFIN
jgi:hypothetical protein